MKKPIHATRWNASQRMVLNLCDAAATGHNAGECYECGEYHRKVTCRACLKKMKKRKVRK